MAGGPDTSSRWKSLAALYAVLSFGFSQIFFNLVQINPRAFPAAVGFAVWTLLWIQIIPLLLLFLLDRIFHRFGAESYGFRIWRAVLYSALVIVLLKQFSVFHERVYWKWAGFVPSWILFFAAAALIFVLSFTSRKIAQWAETYLALAGMLSLSLPLFFLYSLYSVAKAHPVASERQVATRSDRISSVYMIIFDETSLQAILRNGSPDAIDFPNFSGLAGDSLWLRNATTNHWATVNSLPSILTGKIHPSPFDPTVMELLSHQLPNTVLLSEIEVENWLRHVHHTSGEIQYRGKGFFLSRNPVSAIEFIGYRLWGFLTFRLPQNILFDDPEYHVTLDQQQSAFLESIRPDIRQFVLWHCSLPHSPFLYTSRGGKHHQYPDFFPFEKEYRKSEFATIFDRYREQIRYTDRILGQILQKMKSTGAYRNSILIVTSDHGVRVWGDLFHNIDLIARVPVFIHIPGRQPAVIDSDFQLADLAPTLLDALGYQYSKTNFDGHSALSGPQTERQPMVYFHPAEFAYIRNSKTGEWVRWLPGKATSGIDSITAPSVSQERGFYAVQAVDDAMMAREQGTDFLARYLQRHFPKSITQSDIQQLESRIENMNGRPVTPSNQFKRGMNYFFLALAETQLISSGTKLDASAIDQHWTKARDTLKTAGDLQPLVADAIGRLILESDANNDDQLDEQELTEMIRSRASESR